MLAAVVFTSGSALPLDLAAADPVDRRDPGRPGSSPDAVLIDLCEAHPALIEALNSDDRDCDDSNPHWLAYEASRDAIGEAKPQTLAGLRAKALVAKLEARNPDGSETPESTMGGTWAWDLLHDILRLTGGAA